MAHLLFKGGPFFVIMKLIKTRGDNMALIKQVAEVKPKLQKKVITIKHSTWKEAENYIKYAGIRGSAQEKMEFLVEQALLHVFANDQGYQDYIKPKAAQAQKAAVETSKELTPKANNDKKWAK